jgi:hypothetical protein
LDVDISTVGNLDVDKITSPMQGNQRSQWTRISVASMSRKQVA